MTAPDLLTGPAMPPALSTLVADRLREMIMRGVLAPGERLKEVELAESMNVSRGPIREAITLLEREGLIVSQRHRGARVITLTYDDIEEVYSLRLALERLAMRRAAERITPATIERLDAVIERMRAVATSPDATDDEHVVLDLAFHDVVYDAAEHERLRRSWDVLRSQVAMFLNARTDRAGFRTHLHDEHRVLRDVLASGDQDAAADAIEAHIGWTLRELARAREARPGSDPLAGPGPDGKPVR